MQTLLFIYLRYIRPFRDYISHQLKLTSFDHSNPHVFAPYAEAVKCFPAARCLRSLQRSSRDTPFQLNTALYRQIAVSIAKKHLPKLVQPFDAHIPQDQTRLLRLLAYQTGHRPRTQARNYAIDQNYPSRLQPELIERYDANSRLGHEFHMIRKEDIIDRNMDHFDSSFAEITGPPTLRPTEHDLEIDPPTDSDSDHEDEEDESSEVSEPIVVRRSIRRAVVSPRYPDQGRHRARNTRRRPPQDITTSTQSLKRTRQKSSESPDSKRIKCIQAELVDILQARKRKRNKRMDC